MSRVSTVLDTVRQPEYVGENRCVPCTIVNTVIAIVLAAATALILTAGIDVRTGALVGATVFTVSATAIGLRGYLVPGTPRLTKRYLPDRVLAYFDAPHGDETAGSVPTEVDVEAVLVSTGILAPCPDVDDLCLDDDLRADWRAAMDAVGAEDATQGAVADLLDVDEADVTLLDRGAGAFIALVDGVRVGQWESRAALVADAAAAGLVAERDAAWSDRPVAVRGELLGGLRLFLETCPDCGGTVRFGQETVESCCRSRSVVAVACEACDARLFEAPFEGEPEPAGAT